MQNACIAEATKLGAFADEFRTKSNTHYRGGIKFSHHVGSTCGRSPERSREPVSAGAPCSRPGVCVSPGGGNSETLGLLTVFKASRVVMMCLCCHLFSPHRWAADREQRGDGPGQVRVRGQQQRRGALLVPR